MGGGCGKRAMADALDAGQSKGGNEWLLSLDPHHPPRCSAMLRTPANGQNGDYTLTHVPDAPQTQ